MSYFKEKTTEKITFATDSNYWVEVSTDMTWADMKAISNVDSGGEVSYQADALLKTVIVAWNLDKDGEVLPVTPENIDLIQRPDIEKIIAELGGKIEEPVEAKKVS
jgi:hypothetical protein